MVDKDYFDIEKDPIKMNEIKDILNEGEQVLVELTPNKKDFILEAIFKGLPFVLIWVAFDVFFLIQIFGVSGFDTSMKLFIIIPFFILHLIPLWLYIGRVVKRVIGYKNIKYVFTDQRIIIRDGLIGIDFKFFYYSEINSVEVKVGILDRLFKVGDIYIHSDTKQAIIEDINNPYEYSKRIQKLTTDLKSDIYYPNDLRPKENHGYNTRYKRKDEE